MKILSYILYLIWEVILAPCRICKTLIKEISFCIKHPEQEEQLARRKKKNAEHRRRMNRIRAATYISCMHNCMLEYMKKDSEKEKSLYYFLKNKENALFYLGNLGANVPGEVIIKIAEMQITTFETEKEVRNSYVYFLKMLT